MKQFSNIPALLYDQDRLNELFKLFIYGMGALLVNILIFIMALSYLWSSENHAPLEQ